MPLTRQLIGKTPDRSITEKLKKALPKIADKDKRRQAEAMISSPAYSYRIKRLENLGNNVRKQCSQLYNTEVLADDSFFRGLCDDAYKHCIFDMQKGMGVSSAFDIMPTSRINRILGAKWSGEHFSARVWGNTNALADGLQNDLLVGIMSGKSEKKMAEDIMNRCAVGAFEARRLVRTEACYIANQAELDGYRQTGIESYEFSAVLDSRTSDLCEEQNGKVYEVTKAVPGKNLPPMHPFCRSTTLPVLPSEEELDREIAELSDEIGADVDFEEWKENLQETGDGRLVYRAKAVDKSGESGIIEVGRKRGVTQMSSSVAERKFADGNRRSPFYELTEQEIEMVKSDILAIGANPDEFVFNSSVTRGTCFLPSDGKVHVKGNIFPDEFSEHPRDRLTVKAVLAHEYYGHKPYREQYLREDSLTDADAIEQIFAKAWADEFRASYMAAKNTPNLSDEERCLLILDSLSRAKEAGVTVKNNEFIRRVLYG